MDPARPSLLKRFIGGLPQIPDTVFVPFLLLMLFGAGFLLGAMTYSVSLPQDRPSFQQQLDALDARLRILEHR